MNKRNEIDDLFKEHLYDGHFTHQEAMWNKMEAMLNNNNVKKEKKKKRFLLHSLIGLFLFGILAVLLFLNKKSSYNESNKAFNAIKNTVVKKADNFLVTNNKVSSVNIKAIAPSKEKERFILTLPSKTKKDNKEIFYTINNNLLNDKATLKITITPAETFSDIATTEQNQASSSNNNKEKEKENQNNQIQQLSNTTTNKIIKVKYPLHIGFEANIDLFKKKEDFSYSYGIEIEKQLNKNVTISLGGNFSKNNLTMNYSKYDKDPSIQKQIAASLHSLTMLRFPIMYQQQLNNSKISAKAGLVPSYLLTASIINVPNNFTGNPTSQRTFSINDLNRFGVLFSAGINYDISKHLRLKLNGYYGLTGLVKDGYINRSRINDNLKNLQTGISIRF